MYMPDVIICDYCLLEHIMRAIRADPFISPSRRSANIDKHYICSILVVLVIDNQRSVIGDQ